MIDPATARRHGLRESLEAYASRLGVPREVARPFWRAWAIHALTGRFHFALASRGICRVSPGVPVPTLNPYTERTIAP